MPCADSICTGQVRSSMVLGSTRSPVCELSDNQQRIATGGNDKRAKSSLPGGTDINTQRYSDTPKSDRHNNTRSTLLKAGPSAREVMKAAGDASIISPRRSSSWRQIPGYLQ